MNKRGLALTIGVVVLMAGVACVRVAQSRGNVGASPRCRSSWLEVRSAFYGAGLGQFLETFTIKNRSARTCALGGWPVIRRVWIGARITRVTTLRVVQGRPLNDPWHTVVLGPGAFASFAVFGADADRRGRICRSTTKLAIALPGSRRPTSVAAVLPLCGAWRVAPVVVGRSDRESWTALWHR